jgi:hypothetical protein
MRLIIKVGIKNQTDKYLGMKRIYISRYTLVNSTVSSSSSLSPADARRMWEDFDKGHVAGARKVPYYLSGTPHGKEKNPDLWTKWLRSMPRTTHSLWLVLYPASLLLLTSSIASIINPSYVCVYIYIYIYAGLPFRHPLQARTADLLNAVLPS